MHTFRVLARLVKLEHTVFALPYAYAGMVLGARAAEAPITWQLIVWVTVAMVGARTLAMGCNRIIDAGIDARNPRTADREIPSGALRVRSVVALCLVSLLALLIATTQLDPITRVLWPIPVALFVLYPYTKRFTWACHGVLGSSIGLAPLAAWLAAGGPADTVTPYLLSAGVAAWIAGFDIIYATADIDFDRAHGVQSVPARFGITGALGIVRTAHLLAVVCWALVVWTASLGVWGILAVLVAAGLLVWENAMVRPDDLSRIDRAFFTVNAWVGVVLGAGCILGGR